MKKLVFPFVAIEVPDDFPDGLDPEATFQYAEQHPDVSARISREYEAAYRKWKKSQDKTHAKKSKPHKAKRGTPMKKLVFPFVEIEVPADFPSGLDFEAVDRYISQHPEIGDQIIDEYETAYRKWVKNKEKTDAQTTHQPYEATARS
ncbi:hypothetical protein HYR99_12655 [Candidatus Poribacteria bacterium]|nr:hypothetical protein [Candidatus Poribacteria bacterium]